MPPVADVEGLPDFGSTSLERTFISNWVQVFSDTINTSLGTRPLIYTSRSGANTRYTSAVASQHELWLALWQGTSTPTNPPDASDTPLFGNWLFWQWTNTASVPGISGNVDANVFDGTLAELEALQITLATNPGGGFPNVVSLGNFESGETPFQWSTSFSGSNRGILTGSDAIRTTSHAYDGNAAQAINIVGDTTDWFLRHVSGNASPAASPTTNTPFESTGFVGFWLKTEDAGITVSLAVDDIGSSVDRGVGLEVVSDGRWHLYEWDLNDESQWEGWTSGANGIIDGLTVTIDSIQFSGAGNVSLYLDGVAHNPDGSLLSAPGDFDYDGDVDADDLAVWQTNFGMDTGAAMNDGDADGDGDVDGRDFLAWQNYYQPTSPLEFVAVPEPAMLTLAAMFALVGLVNRPERAISRVTTAA